MKCDNCYALLQEGYEYPEYYCGLGEYEVEFADGSIGCRRKSVSKIKDDLKTQRELEEPIIIEQMGDMANFFSQLI